MAALLLTSFAACRKEQAPSEPAENVDPQQTLSLDAVKIWYQQRPVTEKAGMDWEKAESVFRGNQNYWLLPLTGQPEMNGVKQGYRKAAFLRDNTGAITERLLDIIPDAAYFQRKGRISTADFTGRVFIYDTDNKLIGGEVYIDGKQAGEIKPPDEGHIHTDQVQIIENCYWHDANYINADGELVIYSEKVCTYQVYDDGLFSGGNSSSGSSGQAYDNGGPASPYGAGPGPSSPPPAGLPQEDNEKINPKAYMNCFAAMPDIGSKMTITVYVQEPAPGLPFNLGPNSVGHTAIGLTKTYNGQNITQVVGFYPDATGKAKMHAPSRILDNSDLGYTVSIKYDIIASEFNKIAAFISDPPATYDVFNYNCTNFVYDACKTGGITLPSPIGNMGLAQEGMMPGALGNSIRNVVDGTNGSAEGGRVAPTHGPCN